MPLLNHLQLPPTVINPRLRRDKLSQLLNDTVKIFLQQGINRIELTDEDLQAFGSDDTSVTPEPHPSSIMGQIIAPSCEEMDKDNYLFKVTHLHAPFAARLLARFSYSDEAMAEKLRQCLAEEQEQHPDAVMAEIVHLPEDRIGNVLIRPHLRAYEIPYLCQSALPKEQQIPVEDLYVSVRNGKIVLHSAKLNKDVLPRLTNAHGYGKGLSIYRFLCDLQFQHVAPGFEWDWRTYQEEPHLPRITYKKFVLSRERWFLKTADYLSRGQDNAIRAAIDTFRKRYQMPRYVIMQEFDNELLLDMELDFCLENLIGTLKKKNVTLYEFLSAPDNCMLKDSAGSYTTEIILPVPPRPDNKNQMAHRPTTLKNPLVTRSQRFFEPGSEWCYLKIYAGYKAIENILTEIVRPFIVEMLQQQKIDRFFFIRYADPTPHLRLRMRNSAAQGSHSLQLLDGLHQSLHPLIANGQVSRLVVDTYVREIERYGDTTMDLSEQLFFHDSVATLDFLDMIAGSEGEIIRWQMALVSVDSLLDDFGYSLAGNSNMLKYLSAGYFREFNQNKKESESQLSRSLNDKYRDDYPTISRIMTRSGLPEELGPALACYRQRSLNNSAVVEEIRTAVAQQPGLTDRSNRNDRPISELLPSYIHMAINRLFVSRQRTHELIVYHYLNKYYDSQLRRRDQVIARAAEGMEGIKTADR